MELFIVDTHALAWYFTKDERLGEEALKVFRNSVLGKAIIIVPTIVLAELIDIIDKKRIKTDYEELLNKIEESANFEIYPLDINVLKILRSIPEIYELHDRIIVATAKLLEAKVITKDENIKSSNLVEIVW